MLYDWSKNLQLLALPLLTLSHQPPQVTIPEMIFSWMATQCNVIGLLEFLLWFENWMQDHEETKELTLKIGLLIWSQYIHNLSSLWITSRSPSSSSPSWPPPAQSPPPWSRMREGSRSTLQLQSSLSHLGRGQQRMAMSGTQDVEVPIPQHPFRWCQLPGQLATHLVTKCHSGHSVGHRMPRTVTHSLFYSFTH